MKLQDEIEYAEAEVLTQYKQNYGSFYIGLTQVSNFQVFQEIILYVWVDNVNVSLIDCLGNYIEARLTGPTRQELQADSFYILGSSASLPCSFNVITGNVYSVC